MNTQKCNLQESGLGKTAHVVSYPSGASPSGCQDMTGNVAEWCKGKCSLDYYSEIPPGGWIDPQGPASGDTYVLQGGGWYGLTSIKSRSAFRYFSYPWYDYNFYGFRLIR